MEKRSMDKWEWKKIYGKAGTEPRSVAIETDALPLGKQGS